MDASVFREQYQARVAVVKSELVRYLVCNKGMVSDQDEAADKVDRVTSLEQLSLAEFSLE